MTTIQEKIREIIQKKKLSIYQVAQAIGVDHANLYRSLANGSNLELNTMLKVLDFLGYEIQFAQSKTGKGGRMKFKVDNDFNLVAYDPGIWGLFPDPGNSFQLLVRDGEYTTSKRNLTSRGTSFAKIHGSKGKRISHRDFCSKYGLRKGENFQVEVVKPFRVYKLLV